MSKSILFLSLGFLLLGCGTKTTEVKKETVTTVVNPVQVKVTKYKNEVSNLQSQVNNLDITLSWEIENTEELGGIEIYQKLPKGKLVKIAELEANSRDFSIALPEFQENLFKIKLISTDGRSSYGKSITPSMIFTARDEFFQ